METTPERSSSNSVQAAINSAKIAQCDDRRLSIAIHKCAHLAGTNPPDKEQTALILEFLRKQRKGYGIEELGKAFTLYADNKLPHVEHYGKMNPKFLTNVLDNYSKTHRRRALQEQPQRKLDALSSSEKQRRSFEFIKGSWSHWKEKGSLRDYFGAAVVFKRLEERGVIQMSNEDKHELLEQVREEAKEEAQNKGDREKFSEIARGKDLKSRARTKALEQFFMELDMDGNTLVEFLTK